MCFFCTIRSGGVCPIFEPLSAVGERHWLNRLPLASLPDLYVVCTGQSVRPVWLKVRRELCLDVPLSQTTKGDPIHINVATVSVKEVMSVIYLSFYAIIFHNTH